MGLKLVGEVALDGSGFERGLNSMASSVKGFIAGAFGLYAIDMMIRRTVDVADELVNTSKRLDVTIEQLQLLKHAAKEGGTELDALAKGLENLDAARDKANSGSKEGQKLLARFSQVGISQVDLKSKTAADLFMGPLRVAAESRNAETLGPILKDILGKPYRELIPVLKTDFDGLRKKLEALGLVMSTTTAVSLKSFADELGLASGIIVNALGPALVSLAQWILQVVSHKGFIRDVLEGVDFRIRQLAGNLALPEGARTAHDAAIKALEMIRTTDQRETSPEQFRAQWADYFTNGLGRDRNPEYAGFFSDDKSRAWADELRFLNERIRPVEDVSNTASTAASADMEKLRQVIEAQQARIAAEIERLKHPTPPDFSAEPPAEKEAKPHRLREPGDALLRVGNFLGSARSALEDIGQQQVQLLRQIVTNTGAHRMNDYQGDVNFDDSDFGLT